MIPITPDEALYAFMDGELDLHDEQRLFDSLAADPELRSEMKDHLSIRNAVHRDQLFPTAAVESGILVASGLAPAASAGGIVATTGAAATWWQGLSPLLYTAGGVVAGVLVMFSTMNIQSDNKNGGLAGGTGSTQPPTQPLAIAGPAQSLPQAQAVHVDTVYVRQRIVEMADAPEVPIQPLQVVPESVEDNATLTSIAVLPVTTVDPLSSSRSILTSSSFSAAPYGSANSQGLMSAERMSPRQSGSPVSFGFRTLASGLSSSEPTPESVTSTVLPNTAFSLTIPLNEVHRVGVEMGTESFNQTFTGFDGYRESEWTQTPVVFWLGATYQFAPTSFEILPGLSPFAQATFGAAFSQGPVARGTVGLSYQPIGPVRFTVGLDGSALFYTFQNSWFTSTKWGLSYGLSIDLGTWQ